MSDDVNGTATRYNRYSLTESNVVAVRIAWDELVSYIDAVGDEGSLDDEDMPNGKLRWAERQLHAMLVALGELTE